MKIFSSKNSRSAVCATVLLLIAASYAAVQHKPLMAESSTWSEGQWALLQALALPQPEPITPDAKSDLGRSLFFDTQLNADRDLGCASCHKPELGFSDGLTHPDGNPQKRNTPSVVGAARNDWQFWDGRKDSLWSQTLEPLFAPHEIALTPDTLLQHLANSAHYQRLYESAYGTWPQPLPPTDSPQQRLLLGQLGMALAAFIETLDYPPSPFDRYVYSLALDEPTEAEQWLNNDEVAGLKIMLRSNCLSCHRGAQFSDGQFHNIGTGESDKGRSEGKQRWLNDPYNCKGETAQKLGQSCGTGVLITGEAGRLQTGAFKTPSLRELVHTAPYMHDGRFETLEEVIEHYRNPPETQHGLSDMAPLTSAEAAQLVAFLKKLSSAF